LIAFLGHLLKNGMTLLTFFLGIENAKQLDIKLAQKLTDTPFLQAFIEFSFFDLITFFPFFLVVVIMLWRSSVWERQVIRKELASEEEPMITKEEYEAVKRDSIFKTHRVKNVNRHTRAAIVKAQSKLAIRKWRVKQKGQAVETDALVLSWRNELVRLRNEIE
jgi:protease PrsW